MNTDAKKAIYLSNLVFPIKSSGGGSIVIYRHFKRLIQNHWEVKIFNTFPFGFLSCDSEFDETKISKKAYFPPLKRSFQFSIKLRSIMLALIISNRTQLNNSSILLGIAGEYTTLALYYTSIISKRPLFLIYHDDDIFSSKESLLSQSVHLKILKKCSAIFVVSELMKELLISKGIDLNRLIVLPPIADDLEKSPIGQFNGKMIYSGWINAELHSDILNTITKACEISECSLHLISHLTLDDLNISSKNVTQQPFIEEKEDYDRLLNSFSLALVFYSFDENKETRLLSSFPSKFIQYIQLGIPVVIIAPDYSTIGQWAVKHHWQSYIPQENVELIAALLEKFRNQDFWQSCAEQSKLIGKQLFNPTAIHQIFECALEVGLKPDISDAKT